MNKRILFFLFAMVLVFAGRPGDLFSKAGEKSFSGRVILVGDDYIELKKNKTEIILYFTAETGYFLGSEAALKSHIEICQEASAQYVFRDGRNELVKLVILKNSNCVK